MITLKTNNVNWNLDDYPEYTDDFYKTYGGCHGSLEKAMVQFTDSNKQLPFNRRLYQLVQVNPLEILDIGCGGGSLVESFIEDGHEAYGIDGNPWFNKLQMYSWAKYPKNLFVADIGNHFELVNNDATAKFDVITSWEFFEHINPNGLEAMVDNIDRHSKAGTWLIFSASQRPDWPWHKTIKSKEEWVEIFQRIGFNNTEVDFGREVFRYEPDSVICYLQKN